MTQVGDLRKPRLGSEAAGPGGIAKNRNFISGRRHTRARQHRNDYFRSMVAAHGVERNSYWLDHGLRAAGAGEVRRAMEGRKIRHGRSGSKIISFRRQAETGWHRRPDNGHRLDPAFADRAAAMGKQRKILFVQAVFIVANQACPGLSWRLALAWGRNRPSPGIDQVPHSNESVSTTSSGGIGAAGASVEKPGRSLVRIAILVRVSAPCWPRVRGEASFSVVCTCRFVAVEDWISRCAPSSHLAALAGVCGRGRAGEAPRQNLGITKTEEQFFQAVNISSGEPRREHPSRASCVPPNR